MKNIRTALLANGSFSGLSGLILLVGASSAAEVFGVSDQLVFQIVGGGLILFALSLFFLSNQKEIRSIHVWVVISQDWIWVLGSMFILIWRPFGISMIGNFFILGVAIIVGLFALWQQRALRLMR